MLTSVVGTADTLTIRDWYLGSAFHVEQFKTADGKVLADTRVDLLVQAMAAFSPPAAGTTTLPASHQTALAPVLAANWQLAAPIRAALLGPPRRLCL